MPLTRRPISREKIAARRYERGRPAYPRTIANTTSTRSRYAGHADIRKRYMKEKSFNSYSSTGSPYSVDFIEELNFVILGNPDSVNGNPVPYKRTIGGVWSTASTKYWAWKDYVRASFSDIPKLPKYLKIVHFNEHPIKLKGKYASVDIGIDWVNNKRGDGDNVLKGILDSLFDNDKDVLEGHYKSNLNQKAGRVYVTIKLYDARK